MDTENSGSKWVLRSVVESLVFLVGTKTVLTDVDGVAQHLAADPSCALGLSPSVGAASRHAAEFETPRPSRRLAIARPLRPAARVGIGKTAPLPPREKVARSAG